jgi:DNA-binding NtrC family response regulator
MDDVTVDGLGTMGRALVVDDLPGAREIIGDQLRGVGFTVLYAEDGLVAFDLFVREAPGLIVTDWRMPRLNGVGLVRRIREISNVPVVMLTAFGSIRDCEEAMRVGVDRYLQSGRDLQRVGEVARELMKDRIAEAKRGGIAKTPRVPELGAGRFSLGGALWTAAEARSLAQQELRKELQKQLFECRGNVSEMARRMGKDRSTIRYHLRRLGMLESSTTRSTRAESPDSHSSKSS